MKSAIIITTMMLSLSSIAKAENGLDLGNKFNDAKTYFINEWEKSNTTDLYIPFETWHNRADYTAEKIASFNETPYGLGIGKSYRDSDSNWHGYYAMVFSDSHSEAEPIVGYAFVKNLLGNKDGFNTGVGYTLFVTARHDSSYIPIPAVLPLFSVGYNKFTINATYIPGGKGDGNVAFFWSQYNF